LWAVAPLIVIPGLVRSSDALILLVAPDRIGTGKESMIEKKSKENTR
jgi:hypothetical protein